MGFRPINLTNVPHVNLPSNKSPAGDECVSLVTSPTPFETATWLIPNQTDLWLNTSRWAVPECRTVGVWTNVKPFQQICRWRIRGVPTVITERGSETSIESLLWWAIRLGILSWCQISINPRLTETLVQILPHLERWIKQRGHETGLSGVCNAMANGNVL